MAYTLHTYSGNPKVFKILIAAQYNGVTIDIPHFDMGVTNKSKAFLKMNPMGKVPVLETPMGPLVESDAIARYVARMRNDTGLYGKNFFESGQVDAWMDMCSHEVGAAVCPWVFSLLGFYTFNAAVTAKAREDVKKYLQVLENHLLLRTFLVGESITLADIAMASMFVYPMKFLLDSAFRKPYPCVMRWFNTCVNQPEFQAIVGDVPLCDKEVLCVGDTAPASTKKVSKKPEKKKVAAPVVEDKPKKVIHPLALLNKEKPSSMVMDEWKVCYSNTKPLVKSMDWFWKNLDSEGYSLWWCTYNYNEENTKAFMTCNAVGGFLQRSEGVRKYAFGVMDVLGEEGKTIDISGCWLFRGQTAAHIIEANPDAEYYTWTKIETLDDATKQKVTEFWCNEDTLNGKPIIESKVFK